MAIAVRLRFALDSGVEAVRDQVEKNPCDFLRKDVYLASRRIEGSLQPDVEPLLLGAGTVIGKIDSFIDEGIDIDRPVLSEPSRECSSMFLIIESARLPC